MGGHLAPREPRVAWSLDCAPSLQCGNEKRTILIMVEDFSKMVILEVLRQHTSQAVSEAFTSRVLACYGRPSRVRVDRGKEFAGDFQGLCDYLGIRVVRTAVHSPWTNGVAERTVRFAKDLLKKVLVGVDKELWPSMVPWVQAAMNHTVSRATSLSPHEVFFGEPPSPLLQAVEDRPPVVDWHLGRDEVT